MFMRSVVTLPLSWLLLSCVVGLTGCATAGKSLAGGDTAGEAQCLVCKHNADLGCVNLKITDQTPSTVYQGKTYYFCSPDCRRAFEQEPSMYAGR